MLFIIDLWLDGYDDEEELRQACLELINEELNFSGSSVEVLDIDELFIERYIRRIKNDTIQT